MITYTPTDSHSGFFTINGTRKSCDEVFNAYLRGVPACSAATPILEKWKRESEKEAAFNERIWNEFTAQHGNVF